MNRFIYLDANASMPALPVAKAALLAAMEVVGNPSSPHALGRQARRLLDEARAHVAAALGGTEKEVFFNSGASEGNRWLVDAVVRAGEVRGRPLRVMATKLEHPSLAKALHEAHAIHKIVLHEIDDCLTDIDVIFATAAHNESGIVTDWEALIKAAPSKCILIADASQAMARLPVLPKRIDAIVCSAHKMGGLAGCGAVLLRGNARNLPAPWAGGGQEAGLRPGTEALALLAAFGAAAQVIEQTRVAHAELESLRDRVEATLLAMWPSARILGQDKPRLPNTTAITLANVDGEALRMAIDMVNVCVGFGAACSSLAPEPSPSLIALGLTPAQARSTIRISLYPGLEESEVMEALERLRGILPT